MTSFIRLISSPIRLRKRSAADWLLVVWLLLSAARGPLPTRAAEGTVILHGGGTVSAELRDRFFELAGGKSSRLVVIPTADPDTPDDDGRLTTWRMRQPRSITLLHAASHEKANTDEFAAPLKQATGVWISGGRQSLLAATYLKTPVERELLAIIQRGGVVAGTSAGAAIQSQVMIVRGEIREGFNLVPGAVIDQHFLARQRQDRLLEVLKTHPHRLGIGVDENTAAIIRGHRLEVLGNSTVSLCSQVNANSPPRILRIKSGESIDLKPLRDQLPREKSPQPVPPAGASDSKSP